MWISTFKTRICDLDCSSQLRTVSELRTTVLYQKLSMKYKYITKLLEILILSRSYHKNISTSVHIFKLNILFFAMQKSSEIKLWVTGKVESSEVETNSLRSTCVIVQLYQRIFARNNVPVA